MSSYIVSNCIGFRRFLLAYVSTPKMVFVFRTIRIPALETSRQNINIGYR